MSVYIFYTKKKKTLTVSAVLLVTNAENETFYGCSSFLLIILSLLQGVRYIYIYLLQDC